MIYECLLTFRVLFVW